MKILFQSHLILIGALAVSGAAYAQQPPDTVISDSMANTAMGTGALLNLNLEESGCHNTASGDDALYSDTGGSYNTATGFSSLFSNTTGNNNTAAGYESLYYNSTGSDNTASGYQALYANTTGSNNTASGYDALYSNTTGSDNTASGYAALAANTTGSNNTASGYDALYSNTTGNDNTASGYAALNANSTGNYNTAAGYYVLFANTVGSYNNASGYFALRNNSSGSQNSASGVQALVSNKSGNYNTASGTDALFSNTSGSSNIAEGYKAGYNLTTGSNNIDIGNVGVAAESGVIRIGTSGQQTQTFIAGINNSTVAGGAVVVDPVTGQLGVLASSERFKTAIAPMGSDTARLEQLRPVSFKLKSDATGTRQYGLIAEEVANVYPELVIRDQTGRINGVRYDELAPMLLNEVQQQQSKLAVEAERNGAQDAHIAAQDAKINELTAQLAEMRAAFERLRTDAVVAPTWTPPYVKQFVAVQEDR